MLQRFIENFTYLGVFLMLFGAGLGLPIPEEAPVLAAGALAHEDVVRWWIALPVCILGVLSGDVVLYWIGHHWGEVVLDWRGVRRVEHWLVLYALVGLAVWLAALAYRQSRRS